MLVDLKHNMVQNEIETELTVMPTFMWDIFVAINSDQH